MGWTFTYAADNLAERLRSCIRFMRCFVVTFMVFAPSNLDSLAVKMTLGAILSLYVRSPMYISAESHPEILMRQRTYEEETQLPTLVIHP